MPDIPRPTEFESLRSAAARTDFSVDTFRALINSGRLAAYRLSDKPGSAIRVRCADVNALMRPLIPEAITGGAPLFHNTQYFMEQRGADWDGEWHRDTQFLAAAAETERRHIAEGTGVHFRVALMDDPWLRIVPGSHRRWDTAHEWAIRRERAGGDPANAVSVPLKAGDAMLFHAWSIHQGLYRRKPARRTFDVIYMTRGTGERALPPRTCMPSPVRMASLPREARAFYERFARSYRRAWESA